MGSKQYSWDNRTGLRRFLYRIILVTLLRNHDWNYMSLTQDGAPSLHVHYRTHYHIHVQSSCNGHVGPFLWYGVGHGHPMAVTASTWLLQDLYQRMLTLFSLRATFHYFKESVWHDWSSTCRGTSILEVKGQAEGKKKKQFGRERQRLWSSWTPYRWY